MPEQPHQTPHNYPHRQEDFEVVLIKEGVSDLDAKPDDFKRVPVSASSPLQAEMDDKCKVKGYRTMFTAKPGVLTDPEIQARRRALEGPTTDKSKI